MRFLTSAFFIFAYVTALTLANKTQFHELIKSQHKENESLGRNSKSGREEYSGNGNLLCYGNMEVSIVKWDTGTGQGKCKPVPHFGAPQGFIADGEDGSHWVVVDDKGYADCYGEITYTTGDVGLGYCTYKNAQSLRKISPRLLNTSANPRIFCGYFTCDGEMNLVCDGMLAGCHGDA